LLNFQRIFGEEKSSIDIQPVVKPAISAEVFDFDSQASLDAI